MRKLFPILILAFMTVSNAHACLESDESKEGRFVAVDVNNDGEISYEEYMDYSKNNLAQAKKNQPSSMEKFIGSNFFGRTFADDDDFSFRQDIFDRNWADQDKNKDNKLSKDEFFSATQTKRFGCGE